MTRPGAVLFDFSGTLFHIESARDAVLAALGAEHVVTVPALERWGAINGSAGPDELPEHLCDVWAKRDLSADAHRAAYSGLARHAGLDEVQAHRLYERGIAPQAWQPYDDTGAALQALHDLHVPTAIVSNIGWDPRSVLDYWGVAGLVDILVLSDERGAQKPDAAIFWTACDELGVQPADAVMIGDNPVADGGAVGAGCRFVLVPADPAEREPGTLLRALGLR